MTRNDLTSQTLRNAPTARRYARAMHRYLTRMAKDAGYDVRNIRLIPPSGTDSDFDGYTIIWEEGPFEWIGITMGTSIFAAELGDYSIESNINVENDRGFYFEALNSYSIIVAN